MVFSPSWPKPDQRTILVFFAYFQLYCTSLLRSSLSWDVELLWEKGILSPFKLNKLQKISVGSVESHLNLVLFFLDIYIFFISALEGRRCTATTLLLPDHQTVVPNCFEPSGLRSCCSFDVQHGSSPSLYRHSPSTSHTLPQTHLGPTPTPSAALPSSLRGHHGFVCSGSRCRKR